MHLGSLICLFVASRKIKDNSITKRFLQNWIPSEVSKIEEPAAYDILNAINRQVVSYTNSQSGSESEVKVNTSFAYFQSRNRNSPLIENISASRLSFMSSFMSLIKKPITQSSDQQSKQKIKSDSSALPIILIHGFDSSCLEFRRIIQLLNEKRDVYAVDILGWGFNDHQEVSDYSPDSKLNHLRSFIKNVVGGPCILVGASLGGAIGIILAAESPELVEKLILIDAQGFIDGGGRSNLPDFFARLGVRVLKSEPLRMYANVIAYADKTFATADAMRIGRLHCLMDSWEDASVDFVKSGGFSPSTRVPKVQQPTLVLWGAQDEILEPKTADKFRDTLPNANVVVLEKCGHVAHLEQPKIAAIEILKFLGDM